MACGSRDWSHRKSQERSQRQRGRTLGDMSEQDNDKQREPKRTLDLEERSGRPDGLESMDHLVQTRPLAAHGSKKGDEERSWHQKRRWRKTRMSTSLRLRLAGGDDIEGLLCWRCRCN